MSAAIFSAVKASSTSPTLMSLKFCNADAALHAVADLAHVILKAFERSQPTLVDLHIIAQDTNFGVALEHAVRHAAACHRAHLGNFEDVGDFGAAKIILLDRCLQQSQHGLAHFILQFVDDGMQSDIHALLRGQLGRLSAPAAH